MAGAGGEGASTRVSRIVAAPREAVYRAFLDAGALASWLPPDGMEGRVHTLEPREGGRLVVSLRHLEPGNAGMGKTSADTDTFEARFVELVPGERIVEVVEFQSEDPAFAGEMRITVILSDADGRTEVCALCEGIPKGVRPEDNEAGWTSSLEKLARLLE